MLVSNIRLRSLRQAACKTDKDRDRSKWFTIASRAVNILCNLSTQDGLSDYFDKLQKIEGGYKSSFFAAVILKRKETC